MTKAAHASGMFLMWASQNHQDSNFKRPLTIEDKITIFLERTDNWQLSIAEQCSTIPHSALAVLQIVLSYFEAIAKYHEGLARDGRSAEFFTKGVLLVFPPIGRDIPEYVRNAILSDLYTGARCGLYHASTTAPHVSVGSLAEGDLKYDPNTRRLLIDPAKLAGTLRAHLADYGRRLREPSNTTLREAFERRFDYDASRCHGVEW